MKLSKLELINFRNYQSFELRFESRATVLVGENAVGKTNILEAIYLLATGLSFRAGKIEEMVRWGEEVGHVVGEVKTSPEIRISNIENRNKSEIQKYNDQKPEGLRVTLTRGEVQGKRVQKRRFLVNEVGRRRMDFVGHLMAVKFTPQDLQLINGSPSRRRNYLDDVLMQVDREYRRSLMSYEKAVRRRNKLLILIREGKTQKSAMTFWNQLVIKEGEVITQKRQELVDFVNQVGKIGADLRIEYKRSVISESRLQEYADRELMSGHTLVGPHKDDFQVMSQEIKSDSKMSERDLAVYGSRGEQRMGVLWLKMAELEFVEEREKMRPLLLLDDIFSELDDEHDNLVMDLLGKQQTVVTTTDADGRFEKLDAVDVMKL